MTTPKIISSAKIMSFRVLNQQKEDLGEIKDLMIDTESGQVINAILTFGGFLGIGDKLFAIPWKALKIDIEQQCIMLNVTKETLENAPGIDKENLPENMDADFMKKIYGHYDFKPNWEYEGEMDSRSSREELHPNTMQDMSGSNPINENEKIGGKTSNNPTSTLLSSDTIANPNTNARNGDKEPKNSTESASAINSKYNDKEPLLRRGINKGPDTSESGDSSKPYEENIGY